MKGVYILILKMDENTDIQVGKLGRFRFKKGFYAYAGSARGTGGFKRISRHFNVAAGKIRTRRWHIDYLLPYCRVICAVLLPTDEDIECMLARSFGTISSEIPGFGCSDCSCSTHLFFAETNIKNEILKTIEKTKVSL